MVVIVAMFAGHQVPDRRLPLARADYNLLQREAVDSGRVPRRAAAPVPALRVPLRARRAAAARHRAAHARPHDNMSVPTCHIHTYFTAERRKNAAMKIQLLNTRTIHCLRLSTFLYVGT